MKIVVNRAYGGFRLTDMALYALLEKGCSKEYVEEVNHCSTVASRSKKELVEVVERLGSMAWPANSGTSLEVVEVPDDVNVYIDDYDGYETIREEHRVW